MSLSTFIEIPEVRDKFRETLNYPQLNGRPKSYYAPRTKHYQLVGTAFDYLLRFVIETKNEGLVISHEWVAENAVKMFPNDKSIAALLKDAKECYNLFKKTKEINRSIIRATLLLGQLDMIYRSEGKFPPDLGKVDESDIKDLENLIGHVDPNLFTAREVCILNPIFNNGSILVGGADADILLDNTLIEIKTTKDFKIEKRFVDQLIGYYFLAKIWGISGLENKVEIKNLAIYFSRYTFLESFGVSKIIKEADAKKFMVWFEEAVKKWQMPKILWFGLKKQ